VESEIIFTVENLMLKLAVCKYCVDGTGMIGRIMFAWIQG